MSLLFGWIILLFLFYFLGKIVNEKNNNSDFLFLKAFFSFIFIIITNFIILCFVILFFLFLLTLSDFIFPSNTVLTDKLPTVELILYSLIFILLTAISHHFLRIKYFLKLKMLQLNKLEYAILEYFIQWLTIYIVIYQFLFEGFANILKMLPELNFHYDSWFSVLLTPENINYALQPILMASWILVVVEKMKFYGD